MPPEKEPLTEEQNEELEQVFMFIHEHQDKLNAWEIGFIDDNFQRWQQYGRQVYLSEKQWSTIQKIHQKCEEE